MPQIIVFLGIRVHTYTLSLLLALVLGTLYVLLRTPSGQRGQTANALLAALFGGLLIGRAQHILFNLDYFQQQPAQMTAVPLTGIGWHGALLGGLAGLWLSAWLHGRLWGKTALPFARLLSRLAPLLPLLMAAAWIGCAAAGCGYGGEVRTLADYPPHVTAELPNIYGILAPRWNTPLYGVLWASGLIALLIFARKSAGRFWLALALTALGMHLIGYARADAVPYMAVLRADQGLDIIIFAFSLTLWLRAHLPCSRSEGGDGTIHRL
jgi:prolipoprotein diacylglyceryltransferase